MGNRPAPPDRTWTYVGSTPTAARRESARAWHIEFVRTLGRDGFDVTQDRDEKLAITLRALLNVTRQRLYREGLRGLREEDEVGPVLEVFHLMLLGGPKALRRDRIAPKFDTVGRTAVLAVAIALRAFPEILRRIGWDARTDAELAPRVAAITHAWLTWGDKLHEGPDGALRSAPVALAAHEVLTGHAERRQENFPTRAAFLDYMAASLSTFASKNAVRYRDEDGSGFRRAVKPTIEGVNVQAAVHARKAAAAIQKASNLENDPEVIRTNIVSELWSRGHKVAYGFPLADGSVYPHPNTIIGARKVQRTIDDLDEHGEGCQSLDSTKVDADRDERLARSEDLARNPAALEALGRAVRAALERARRERSDDPAVAAALEYVIAKAEHAVGLREENPTRAEYASRFGVRAWDQRAVAEREAYRVLRAAFRAEGVDTPEET